MKKIYINSILCGAVLVFGTSAIAEAASESASSFQLPKSLEGLGSPKEMVGTLKIVFFLTALTLLPGILLTMTSFTRIIIVLSFVRKALSFHTLPPNQILIGISLFLTIFVMAPVWQRINLEALQPYLNEEITQKEALKKGTEPLQKFMIKQTRKTDIALFMSIAKLEKPKTSNDIPMHILIPSYVLSELKTSFQMGFILFLPFLVIDLVVAMVLTSMGMFMLPPVMISMPFKLILFVLVDGWQLIIQSLISSVALN
ncbi:MAG: flagellar type III secretion system pore protein FliP [Candidatus Brocadiaceae bacterium]|nr:flagellar type III secretion system pore protein FliP [Candidatus Brocadiaceae bacterium]